MFFSLESSIISTNYHEDHQVGLLRENHGESDNGNRRVLKKFMSKIFGGGGDPGTPPPLNTALETNESHLYNGLDVLYHRAKFGEDRTTRRL